MARREVHLATAARLQSHGVYLRARDVWRSEVSSEAVDSAEGVLSVDIIEEGCTQHSSKYAGGMQLVLARR